METKKRSKICYGLLLVFSIIFGVLFVDCSDTNAVSITSGVYSKAIYTKNFESSKSQYLTGPFSPPATVIPEIYNPTGIWDYTQSISFSNPYSNKIGTGYSSSLYFTLVAGDINYHWVNDDISRISASMKLGFEGLSNSSPYCSQVWHANIQDGHSIQFLLESSCPYGTFPANTNFNTVEAFINFEPDSIFWCANDNASRHCPSVFSVAIKDIDYYFGLLTTASDSYNQTIINQNQTIINQNNAYYQHEYDAENNISGQTPNDIDGSTNQQTTNIIGVLTTFVTTLGSIQSGSCELTLPFPTYAGGNVLANPCNYKEKAPTIVTIGSSLLLITVFIPLAFIVLRLIYNEIRSWTNG